MCKPVDLTLLQCRWTEFGKGAPVAGTGVKGPCIAGEVGPASLPGSHIPLWALVTLWDNVGLGHFSMSLVPWNWEDLWMTSLLCRKITCTSWPLLNNSGSNDFCTPPSPSALPFWLAVSMISLRLSDLGRLTCSSSSSWCAATVSSPKTSASALLQIILHYALEMFLTTLCTIVYRSLWS